MFVCVCVYVCMCVCVSEGVCVYVCVLKFLFRIVFKTKCNSFKDFFICELHAKMPL